MPGSHWDPLDELLQLRECLESGGAQLQREFRRRALDVAWQLPLDVYETTTQLVVLADIVGVDPKTVSARIVGEILLVDGIVAAEPRKEPRVYHRHERHLGPFRLVVKLPVPVLPDTLTVAVERWGLEVLILKAVPDTTAAQLQNAQIFPRLVQR